MKRQHVVHGRGGLDHHADVVTALRIQALLYQAGNGLDVKIEVVAL